MKDEKNRIINEYLEKYKKETLNQSGRRKIKNQD